MDAATDPKSNPGTVGGQVRTAVEVAASLAGLTGYVYLIGGMLTWVRLTTAHVPADALTAVMDQKVLFVVGLKAILITAVVFAVICLVSYLAGRAGWKDHRREWHAIVARGVSRAAEPSAAAHTESTGRLGESAVRTVAGFNLIVLSAVVGLSVSKVVERIFPTLWVVIVAFFLVGALAAWRLATWGPLRWGVRGHGLALVFVSAVALLSTAPVGVLILASVAIARLGTVIARLEKPTSAAGFLRSPLPWALFTLYVLVALAYVAQPPVTFTRAVITTASGSQTGGYLARTSDGVYLITCQGLADATSRHERAVLIPAADIKSTTLSSGYYRLDSGNRPSLATLALNTFGINAHPPTWFRVELRDRRSTCGGTLPAGSVEKTLGAGVLVGPAPPGGQASGGEPPIEQTTPPALAELARRFQPTVEVTVADRFWPVSVASVLEDRGAAGYGRLHGGHRGTCLVHQGQCVHSPPTLADLTPVGAGGSDYLDYPATLDHGDPTAQFQAFIRGQGLPERTTDDWLSQPAALDPWRSAQIYFYDAGIGGYGARYHGAPPGLRNLQYWFFYPYNYYPTVVAPRLMPSSPIAADLSNTDLHEGDWEHVSVLIDPKTSEPRYLYMARHDDEGQALPWNSPLLSFDDGHPIVQGALGGHPTYPNRCGDYPRALLKDAVSDWVVCGSGRFAFPASTTPLVDLARTSWACWPGHFGEATPKQVRDGKLPEYDPRKYVQVAGPLSPLRQAENIHVC
jgi:hypothetical protein